MTNSVVCFKIFDNLCFTDKLTEGMVTKIPQPSDTKTLISPIDAGYVTMLERGIETQHKSTGNGGFLG